MRERKERESVWGNEGKLGLQPIYTPPTGSVLLDPTQV